MLCSIKEEGGCKIGAYTSRAGLNLGAVKMRVEQGGRLFTFSIRKDGTDMLVKIFEQGTGKQNWKRSCLLK